MSNLFYVNKLIGDVIAEYVDADGVITDEGMDRLNELGEDKDAIIDDLIKSHKNQQVMIDGIDAEIIRLQLRKDVYVKTQRSILKAIRPHLTEGEKIETAEYILKWTTSSPLEGLEEFDAEFAFNDENDILNKFAVKKVTADTFQFDKAMIKKALKTESTARELPTELYINTTKNPKIT